MARRFSAASSQYLDAGLTADIVGTALTISAWFNVATYTAERKIVAHWGDGNEAVGSRFQYLMSITAAGKLQVIIADSGDVFDLALGATVLTKGIWYHGLGVKNGTGAGALKTFLNGLQDSSITSNRSMTSRPSLPFRIGAGGHVGADGYFDGLSAEVAVWNVALSDPQIIALSAGTDPRLIPGYGLQVFYPLRLSQSPEYAQVGPSLSGVGNPTLDGDPPGLWEDTPGASPIVGLQA